MAMSRSRGGTSFTTSPPIQISPSVISSRPTIIRSVVDLPQPDGPTRTTNSWSAISRSMPFTACTPPPYILTALRTETSAMVLSFPRVFMQLVESALGGTGGQAGHVVIHQEGVDQDRRQRGEHVGGHDLAPLEHIAADQVADDADGQHHLAGGIEISQRIEEASPAYGEGEDRRGDQARHRDRNENLEQHLQIARAIDQRGLIQFLRDRAEVADHDPGTEGHREGRIQQYQAPEAVDQAHPPDDLKQRQEQHG